MAQEPWGGVVVRCTTAETGTVPRNASSQSPDIIMAGTKPFENPSMLTDPANYMKAYDNKLYIDNPNYLYVRGKNYTDGDLSGSWNLFWAEPNILLYPYLWQNNQLATSSGNKNPSFDIKAGEIGASEDSFTWVPGATSSHYCMVAIANTPDHGNPVEGVNNIKSLADVMSNNGNIAQRNTQIITGNVPSFVSNAAYDQGSEGAKVDLAVLFSNLPKGSSYSVASGTPVDGKTLSHSASDTQDNDFKYAWTNLEIPAHWNTMFTYSLTFGSDWSGIPKDAHPKVEIRGELLQDSTDSLYHLGTEAGLDPVTNELRVDATGGPVHMITVGSCGTLCLDVGPP